MTLLKTKRIIFILGHLSGLPTMRVFTRQTMHEKRVFAFFLLPLQLSHFRLF